MTWQSCVSRTIPALLELRLEGDPEGPFLQIDSDQFTASEVDLLSARVGAALQNEGVRPGDRVALLAGNCPEMAVALFAIWRIGAIAVPVNTGNRGGFLRHPLADSEAAVLIVAESLVDEVTALANELPALSVCVVIGSGRSQTELPGTRRWTDFASFDRPVVPTKIDPGDPAAIIYTSGTTGPSKGCVLSHNYLVGRSVTAQTSLARKADDVLWTPMPLFHINAMTFALFGTLLVGGRAVVAPRFSLSTFWNEVRVSGATIASLMGSIATLIAKNAPAERPVHRLRIAIAVPMSDEVGRVWEERFGIPAFSGMYGMTEIGPLSHLPPGPDGQPRSNRPGAAGRVDDEHYEVRLFDDDDREVPAGEVGEIVCRPLLPHMMFSSYWNRPEATLAAWRNLWFHTGDLGRLDPDGFLYLVDRKADYIRRRGENVSSQELEAVIRSHPEIVDVAVHAVRSDLSEDDIKVTAVLAAGATLDEETLAKWAHDRLPVHAWPRYVEFRTDLPRNAIGRALKTELRDQGVTPETWDGGDRRRRQSRWPGDIQGTSSDPGGDRQTTVETGDEHEYN